EMAGRVAGLVGRFPELNVIVVYRDASEEDLAAACRAGVSSLVPESHGLAAVLAQVRRRRARHAREGQRSPGRQGLTDRELEIVVMRGPGPASDAHWARWHRGPLVAVLVDPETPDWDLVADLGIPAILVHNKPFDSPELASALATGASALVAADRIDDHFLAVLRMVSQGYLVVDSKPMRPLLGAARVRWDEHATGPVGLPELTSR